MKEKMIAAFARAASAIALEGDLQVVLDHLSKEVLITSNASACAITLVSRFGNTLELVGSAGYPAGFLDRAREALALGAPLISLQVYRSRITVTRDVIEMVSDDHRFAPYVDMVREFGWTTLVTVPLTVRDERVGVLTAMYADDCEPSSSDLAFLTAMADHGAIAVNTAQLLSKAREKAAQDERNRLARDIHDAVSQSLFSMRLRTKALQMAARTVDDPTGRLDHGLQSLEFVIDRAVSDMRSLVLQLRPADLRNNDLADAIKRYAEAVSDHDAILVEVRFTGDIPTLTYETELHVYQIAREAIANSVDHSNGTRLAVEVGLMWLRGSAFLVVQIADDGVGFDPTHDQPGHAGLLNMRNRAIDIGSELTIESTPAGTTVRLQVPVTPAILGQS